MSPRRAFTELFFASALWGFGFIATVWALQSYSPLWITALRFSLAFAIGLIPIVLTGARREFNRANFKLAFQPGILIALTLIAQTWGLQYTTATKSAFLTVLYVLIVPAIESVFRKAKLPRFHFFFVTIAILGVALICGLFSNANASDLSKTEWNRGDALWFALYLQAYKLSGSVDIRNRFSRLLFSTSCNLSGPGCSRSRRSALRHLVGV
jgi:drug/metabolite transporter (DMT)-like permease